MPRTQFKPLLINGNQELLCALNKFSGKKQPKRENWFELEALLMIHQLYAIRWMMMCEALEPFGGILADERGLGKTWSMIAWIFENINKKECFEGIECNSGTLIVCSRAGIAHWENEITKFGGPGIRIHKHYGPKRNNFWLYNKDVVLTSYRTVTEDRKNNGDIFDIKWTRIILDDAHSIRNPKAKCTLAVGCLKSRFRWAVTGEPVQNFGNDFRSLLKFVSGPLPRKQSTVKRLCLRRTFQDLVKVKALPKFFKMNTERIRLSLKKTEKALYDKVSYFLDYKCDYKRCVFQVIRVQRLQQVCAHPSLLRSTNIFDRDTKQEQLDDNNNKVDRDGQVLSLQNPIFSPETPSTKIEKTVEIIKKCILEKKEKIIIVSKFTSLLDILDNYLSTLGIKNMATMSINGKTKMIHQTVEKFNTYPKPCVLLLSMRLAAAGLNLSAAKNLVLMEVHWNPDLEPEKVACRLGQEEKISVYELVFDDSVDQEILKHRERRMAIDKISKKHLSIS